MIKNLFLLFFFCLSLYLGRLAFTLSGELKTKGIILNRVLELYGDKIIRGPVTQKELKYFEGKN